MSKSTCWIIGAGDFTTRGLNICDNDLVIAADGGLQHLQSEGISPSVILGDFDSLGYRPEGKHVLSFSPEKDDTDLALACDYASEQGYREIYLYGASGSRPDHFLANLQLMVHYSNKGVRKHLIAPEFSVDALTDSECTLSIPKGHLFSVFSADEVSTHVQISGDVKYPLSDGTLYYDRALGVSNCSTDSTVNISVGQGTLLIFYYHRSDIH